MAASAQGTRRQAAVPSVLVPAIGASGAMLLPRLLNDPGLDVVAFAPGVIPALGESWRDLRPEELDHDEVGGVFGPRPARELAIAGFYDEGRDRYVVVPPPTPPRHRFPRRNWRPTSCRRASSCWVL